MKPAKLLGLSLARVLPAPARVGGLLLTAMISIAPSQLLAAPSYPWFEAGSSRETIAGDTLAERFPPPPGFVRQPAANGSWAQWLRGLRLKAAGSPVRLYSGAIKPRQDVHAAVVDIDVGSRDLQQCADAVMRLRAEWLYSRGRFSDIVFDNTNGKQIRFDRWRTKSYQGFRKYMVQVFAYAGTYSLARELNSKPLGSLAIGDVFIRGGFPGHAVLVADVSVHPESGEKRFLLLQSYMPAQDIHVLKNPSDPQGGVWYSTDFGDILKTPEWHFAKDSLKGW